MPRKTALLLALVLVVAAAGVGLLASAKAPAPESSPAPPAGGGAATALAPSTGSVDAALRELDLVKPSRSRPADDFTLPMLGGGTFRLSEHRGKVVLVNFWATWCVPCREEFPLLSRLEKRHRRAGLSVLGVSTDFQKEKPAVEKFLVEQKPSFPNYRKKSGGDDQKFIEAVDSSWGGELPFSVLYDRSGRKVRVFSGELEIAALEKQIVSLLAARAPAPR